MRKFLYFNYLYGFLEGNWGRWVWFFHSLIRLFICVMSPKRNNKDNYPIIVDNIFHSVPVVNSSRPIFFTIVYQFLLKYTPFLFPLWCFANLFRAVQNILPCSLMYHLRYRGNFICLFFSSSDKNFYTVIYLVKIAFIVVAFL